MERFSVREGLIVPSPIKYRAELPGEIRLAIYGILRDAVGTRNLMERAEHLFNRFGLTPLPLQSGPLDFGKEDDSPESQQSKRFMLGSAWFQIFDLAEDIFAGLVFFEEELDLDPESPPRAYPMQKLINDLFLQAGVGWKMEAGRFVARSEEATELSLRDALQELETDGRNVAHERIHAAVRALSLRPKPDAPSAITNAIGALEGVVRAIVGDSNSTLGEILKRRRDLIPAPLDIAADKVWGFASEYARHVSEDKVATIEDAEFIVGLSAALIVYLSRKYRTISD